ncbi:MAG: sulfite exporter TauE/SafE family protein [Alphaproteobacteria bacterium]
MTEFDLSILALAATVLVLGGAIKGVFGVGLPMVTVPLLASFIPLAEAVALMYIPVLLSNLWQACQGGYYRKSFQRFWPMMFFLVGGTWLGAMTLVTVDAGILILFLGILVCFFAVLNLVQTDFRIPHRHELWLSLLVGLIAGYFSGIALHAGPPMIVFLVALHLPKDEFIGSIALAYMTVLIPIGFLYVFYGVLTADLMPMALAATVLVFLGLGLGQWLRGKIDQERFRKGLLIMLLLIGLNLVREAVF